MAKHNAASWYGNELASWPKAAGPKPTVAMFETAHYFGKPGKQSLALAMAMRDGGRTAPQVIEVCERPQNNHLKRVIQLGYFSRVATPADGSHTVYKIELTAKGKAKLEGASMAKSPDVKVTAKAEAPKPVKVKKAKKAKPVTEAEAPQVTVTEPVAAEVITVTEA